MARPPLPSHELCDQEFRLRLQEADADLVRAMAKKLGIAPAALLRSMVKSRLNQPLSFVADTVDAQLR